MPVNQDTDRTKAIIIKNFSHRWLKEADEVMGAIRSNGDGTFDFFAALDRWGYPVVSRLTAPLKKIKRSHKLNA